MDIVHIYISNQVKYDILSTCGKPAVHSYNLLTDTPLHSIGYEENEELCRQLEQKLQRIADEYKTGRSITNGVVSKDLTVMQCIALVMVQAVDSLKT